MGERFNEGFRRRGCAGLAVASTAALVVSMRRERTTTAASVVGLAIVLNVALMTVGMLWSKQQVKRVAAELVAAYRGLSQLDPLRPPGEEVQILVDDERGMLAEVDAVHWPHLGWTDAVTLLRIEDDVLGWRRHPFRQPAPQDSATWPREKIVDELASMRKLPTTRQNNGRAKARQL